MPSRLKKAIAAVKDQTSISLAKVGGSDVSNLEVAILKATTHEEVQVDERHVTEVLQYVSSNRSYAGSCARAIGRRIGRTRNWVVAVKSLVLVLRIFQDGDPHFPKEVLHAMKRGYKILNLSSFRDESTTSCPWDFTAFVRTFALYLDERLDCFLTGKLQRRTSHHEHGKTRGYSRKIVPIVRDMKPSVLLDRISHWQRLLDRAIATRPTGAAKTNRLVQTCLFTIVQETFELYRDISDGLALLLDSFFHLQYNNCVSAFQTCVKASKQFEELCSYYDLCKTVGVGRTSEYPSVQKISDELVETLQEFLKDQSSFPGTNGRTPGISTSLPPLSPKDSDSGSVRRSNLGDRDRSLSEYGGSHCTSLEDLIGADPGFSPDRYSDPGRENPPKCGEFFGGNDSGSVRSDPTDHRGISSVFDLLSLDGPSPPTEPQNPGQEQGVESDSKVGWELVLFETSNQPSTQTNNQFYENVTYSNNASEIDLFSSVKGNAANPTTLTSPFPIENNYINPFLADTIADLNGHSGTHPSEGDLFGSYSHTTSFDANLAEGSFSADLGLGMVSNTTSPTFRADFGNPSTNVSAHLSGGFPSELGLGTESSTMTPTYQAQFGNTSTNRPDHLSVGFPNNLGHGIERSTTLPSFQAEFGSMNGLNNFSSGFPNNLAFGRSNSQPTMFTADFGDDFGNAKSSFVTDFDPGTSNITTMAPTFETGFGNGSMNGLDHYSVGFPADLGFDRIEPAATSFVADFGDDFGNEKNSSVPPTFQADRSSNGIINNNNNHQGTAIDLFGEYGNGSKPKVDPPTFRSDSFGPKLDRAANEMNAIVVFNQPSNDDFFSTGPKLQAAPTFRANSIDMDQQDQQNRFCFENDPFGSFVAIPAVEQQQQLWLQNQHKIISRHLT